MKGGKTALQGAVDYWAEHNKQSQSMVDKYFRALETQITICSSCGKTLSRIYTPQALVSLNIRPENDPMRRYAELYECLVAFSE